MKVTGSLAAILKEALLPNLVQSKEGTPAFVHGGPFANIAHGCNSVLATRMALAFGDYAVTEAGFAFDLGAEKFFDIKCRSGNLNPAAIVIVATIRALKMHGGLALDALTTPDPKAVERGLDNLAAHLDAALNFEQADPRGHQPVWHPTRPRNSRSSTIIAHPEASPARPPTSSPRAATWGGRPGREGGRGDRRPAHAAQAALPARMVDREEGRADRPGDLRGRRRDLLAARRGQDPQGRQARPRGTCRSAWPRPRTRSRTTPSSEGRPKGFTLTVRDLEIAAGAGFVVALTGEIVRMPGLPERPSGERIDVDSSGEIVGLT